MGFFWHGTEHCLLVLLDFFPMGFVQNTSDSVGIMHQTPLESDVFNKIIEIGI